MTRKNIALLAVLVAAAVAIFAGIRMAAPRADDEAPEPPATAATDSRPSPIADSVDVLIHPRRETSKPRPDAKPAPEVRRARSADDGTKDWSVIAATFRSADAASRRADSLKATWKECGCSVFPQGESEHYYVVVGANLDRDSADRLRDRATAAGLPGDTYVTKLIRRPED
jgi:cell division septation protein DedD